MSSPKMSDIDKVVRGGDPFPLLRDFFSSRGPARRRWLNALDTLSYDELERLAKIASDYGTASGVEMKDAIVDLYDLRRSQGRARRDPMRILPAPKRHPMSTHAREKRGEKIDPFKESVVSSNPALYAPGDRVVTRWGLEGTVLRIQHEFWEYGGRAFYLVEDARGVKHSFPEESIAKKARRRR
jgi:hypothetical protein